MYDLLVHASRQIIHTIYKLSEAPCTEAVTDRFPSPFTLPLLFLLDALPCRSQASNSCALHGSRCSEASIEGTAPRFPCWCRAGFNSASLRGILRRRCECAQPGAATIPSAGPSRRHQGKPVAACSLHGPCAGAVENSLAGVASIFHVSHI